MKPIEHTLCGEIEVNAKFDGSDIGTEEPVLSWDETKNEFTIDTDDEDLVGETKPYTLEATLKEYRLNVHPTAPHQTNTKNIVFNNPCLDPFSFGASAQDPAPPTNRYDGDVKWTLKPFNIAPTICEINYECVEIKRTDGVANTFLNCDSPDLDFDGIFDDSVDQDNVP